MTPMLAVTPAVAAALVFALVLLGVAFLYAAGRWAGRTFGGDGHDTIGPP
jgi:cobalamin synthase